MPTPLNEQIEQYFMQATGLTKNQWRGALRGFGAQITETESRTSDITKTQETLPNEAWKMILSTQNSPTIPVSLPRTIPPATTPQPYVGKNANITICLDNGDTTYSEKIARFRDGLLTEIVDP